jgi:hypothetical protein
MERGGRVLMLGGAPEGPAELGLFILRAVYAKKEYGF